MVLEYVEIYNCSQRDTTRSALRFEDNVGAYGRVVGTSIHGSESMALIVMDS